MRELFHPQPCTFQICYVQEVWSKTVIRNSWFIDLDSISTTWAHELNFAVILLTPSLIVAGICWSKCVLPFRIIISSCLSYRCGLLVWPYTIYNYENSAIRSSIIAKMTSIDSVYGKITFPAQPLVFSNLALPYESTLTPYGADAPEWSDLPQSS